MENPSCDGCLCDFWLSEVLLSSFCASNSGWYFRSCKRRCIQRRCGWTKPKAVPWVIHQMVGAVDSVHVCEVLWIKFLHKLGDIDLYQNVSQSCLGPSQPIHIKGGGCVVAGGMLENGKFSCWGKYLGVYLYRCTGNSFTHLPSSDCFDTHT